MVNIRKVNSYFLFITMSIGKKNKKIMLCTKDMLLHTFVYIFKHKITLLLFKMKTKLHIVLGGIVNILKLCFVKCKICAYMEYNLLISFINLSVKDIKTISNHPTHPIHRLSRIHLLTLP